MLITVDIIGPIESAHQARLHLIVSKVEHLGEIYDNPPPTGIFDHCNLLSLNITN